MASAESIGIGDEIFFAKTVTIFFKFYSFFPTSSYGEYKFLQAWKYTYHFKNNFKVSNVLKKI